MQSDLPPPLPAEDTKPAHPPRLDSWVQEQNSPPSPPSIMTGEASPLSSQASPASVNGGNSSTSRRGARARSGNVCFKNYEAAQKSVIAHSANRSVQCSIHNNETHNMCLVSAAMQGWRNKMEDRHFCLYPKADLFPEFLAMMGVLDGHGSDTAAEICSKLLPDLLLKHCGAMSLEKAPEAEIQTAVRAAFVEADAALREQMSGSIGGTTANVAIVTPTKMIFINLGDCRSAMVRSGGEVVTTSKDHNTKDSSEAQRVVACGAQVGPTGGVLRTGSNASLAVTRALGDFEFKPAEVTPTEYPVSALPDVCVLNRETGDLGAIIGCDGVFENLTMEGISKPVQEHSGEELVEACTEMLQGACATNVTATTKQVMGLGLDNMTLTILKFSNVHIPVQTNGSSPSAE